MFLFHFCYLDRMRLFYFNHFLFIVFLLLTIVSLYSTESFLILRHPIIKCLEIRIYIIEGSGFMHYDVDKLKFIIWIYLNIKHWAKFCRLYLPRVNLIGHHTEIIWYINKTILSILFSFYIYPKYLASILSYDAL